MLDRFTAGLAEAGHASEVVDLYAIKFDPVFGGRDVASYVDAKIPSAILAEMDLQKKVLEGAADRSSGGWPHGR